MFLLALIQALDIVVHAALDQLEPLRVLANALVLLWLMLLARGRFAARSVPVIAGLVASYLGLNGWFLARAGMVNADLGGRPRVALLLFVLLTVALIIRVALRSRRP